MVLIWIWK